MNEALTTSMPTVHLTDVEAPAPSMTRWNLAAIVLAGLCCCSSIAVVYTKHLSRTVWADISESRTVIDELIVEWSRLQIEESTFSDHGRVERAAIERLGMTHPSIEDTRFIVGGAVRR